MASFTRCLKHKKDTIAVCNWCGTQVCPLCIVERNGNKVYCEKCSAHLSTYKKVRVPVMPQPSGTTHKDNPKVEPYY